MNAVLRRSMLSNLASDRVAAALLAFSLFAFNAGVTGF